jgi:hypothetical protein
MQMIHTTIAHRIAVARQSQSSPIVSQSLASRNAGTSEENVGMAIDAHC